MVGPDIVRPHFGMQQCQRLVRARIIAQHAVGFRVGCQRGGQRLRRQVRQAGPGFPFGFQPAHGGDRLLFALGHNADEIIDHHQFHDARQVRDRTFIHRQQAAAQRCAAVGACVRRTHHPAMQHAGQAQVVHVGQPPADLGRNIDPGDGAADIAALLFTVQRHVFIQRHMQILPARQLRIAQGTPRVLGHKHLSRRRRQLVGRQFEGFGRQRRQHMSHLRRRLPQRHRRDLYGGAGDGRPLIRRALRIAEDHRDVLERHANFVGDDLRQRGANAGAEIDMAIEGRHPAVGGEADKAVHPIQRQIGRRCNRFGGEGVKRRGQQTADHHHTAGLQQLSAGQFEAAHACLRAASRSRARSAARKISRWVPQRHRL
ncbi:Uncharacterised protein [Acinetobacter baumannii]|nr:Uncharacterised protein [Acinetobacter baumannii]